MKIPWLKKLLKIQALASGKPAARHFGVMSTVFHAPGYVLQHNGEVSKKRCRQVPA